MDYGILHTALDARLLLPHVEVFVIEDACAGVNTASMSEARRQFACEGVQLVASDGSQLDMVPMEQATAQDVATALGKLMKERGWDMATPTDAKASQSNTSPRYSPRPLATSERVT